MRRGHDRRSRIRQSAMRSKTLTWREKCVLIRLTELDAEFDPDTGAKRKGSRPMDADGFVALRREYVARSLGCGLESVKEAEENLQKKGHLSLVHPSSFGRPSKYQALVNNGNETPHPSGGETHGVGGQKTPPLPQLAQRTQTGV
jgi:hypothetical protein